MRIPVHPAWLPGYTDVMQTVLILLTMAGLSPDRPYMCTCMFEYQFSILFSLPRSGIPGLPLFLTKILYNEVWKELPDILILCVVVFFFYNNETVENQ